MIAATRTTYEHIVLDEQGVPWIDEAKTKIVELVEKVRAHGWSPGELAYQHHYLTLGQVHSALAYYWDHREEIEADLERREAQVEEIPREVGEHPLIAKLRAQEQICPSESRSSLTTPATVTKGACEKLGRALMRPHAALESIPARIRRSRSRRIEQQLSEEDE